MATATVESLVEEVTTKPATESVPRWQVERDTHGPESVSQLIGNLTRDAEVEVPEGDKKPYIWGGVAINRGEDMQASFYTYYIYGVKNDPEADESTRTTVPELEALAARLSKGQRVKLQGRTEIRPINEELYAEACAAFNVAPGSAESKEIAPLREMFFAGRPMIRIFANKSDLDMDGTFDQKGRRPVTLLPRIGEDSNSDGLPFG